MGYSPWGLKQSDTTEGLNNDNQFQKSSCFNFLTHEVEIFTSLCRVLYWSDAQRRKFFKI